MNLAQRIQTLRKQKGLSQENLAHELGVSRQAVSKWESEQAYPDLDKIILLSNYFKVSTDYLLKGNDMSHEAPTQTPPVLEYAANFLFFTGLLSTWLLWKYYQTSLCFLPVVFLDASGIMIHFIHLSSCPEAERKKLNQRFWKISILPVGIIPAFFITNLIASYFYWLPGFIQLPLVISPVCILIYLSYSLCRLDSSSH